MRSLHREPLGHFLMLGLGLFLLYAIVSPENTTDTDRRIAVTASDLDWLRSTFASQWNRQPTASEMEGLVEGFIREEVYYREALALSLEEDDTIIRRRLVQKMEFLSEDIALAAEPSEEELQTFFEEHSEDYAIPPRLTFTQIYFSPDERGASTEDDARGVLGELKAMTPPPERAPDRGDRFMLEPDYPGLTPAETDRMFGQGFGEALKDLDEGVWNGPIESGYGLHLVRVNERVASDLPPFEEVRDLVRRDFDSDRRLRMNANFYAALRDRYEIEIDGQDSIDGEPLNETSRQVSP